MSEPSIDPDETGFDDRLRDLATTIVAEAPPAGTDQEWQRDAVFTAMQTHAVLTRIAGDPAGLDACERVGRANMRARFLAQSGAAS